MSRSLAVPAFLLSLALAAAAPAPPPPPPKLPPAFGFAEALNKEIDFPGFDDPKTTLGEALASLEKHCGVRFLINEKAFQDVQVAKVQEAEVCANGPIPAMPKVRLATVLRKVLARVPAETGAGYLMRRDGVEITTQMALQSEVWGENYQGPLQPLIHVFAVNKPLDEILRGLADSEDLNVVLDPKVGEKGKTALSAQLVNTPVDAALDVLAHMADLKLVRIRNIYFVTTPEKAKAIEKAEQEKANRMLYGPLGPGALNPFGPDTPLPAAPAQPGAGR
jgi:hypothetical protein